MKRTLLGVTEKLGSYRSPVCEEEVNSTCTGFVPLRVVRPNEQFASRIMEKSVFEDTGDNEDDTDTENGHMNDSDSDCKGTFSDLPDVEETGLRDFFIRQRNNERVNKFLSKKNLSEDKGMAISIMRSHFDSQCNGISDDYKAPVLLITGGPGVGKSFLVDVMDGVSKIMGAGDQLRLALYGIAAVNISGVTMISTMDIPIEFKKDAQQRIHEWDQEKLRTFKNRFDLTKISAIIIDEISTVKPYMLAYLNSRLQTACNSRLPFGGKAVVLLGDFQQLPSAGVH